MALRLLGAALTGYRTTDHRAEIHLLCATADEPHRSELERLARRCAAALLVCHDDTGISLDDWEEPRALVEYLLATPILTNGV